MKIINFFTIVLLFLITGTINAQIVTTLAGSTKAGSANGIGTAASFDSLTGLVADTSGNLYVADELNNEIRKIVISTGVVTTLAGSTAAGNVNGTGTAARFNQPNAITTDGIGNLYVADRGNNEIRKIIISSGVVTTLAGSTKAGSANGTGTAASFYGPEGLVTDGSGNLYVADSWNNEIRKIVISSGVVTTLAGDTAFGSANGIGTAARFFTPCGIVTDGIGDLYIADLQNNEIRKIVISSGLVTTLVGSTYFGNINGTGTIARFWLPPSIAIDGGGNLYVADSWNNEIRKVVISSALVNTLAGSRASGSANGIGSAATFNLPNGVATDGKGNLYVADLGNNEVRMITDITGINEFSAFDEISIYPNPANQTLYVKLPQVTQSETILKIMDVTGRTIIANSHQPIANNRIAIDVASLPIGLYFICIERDNGDMVTEKFIIQK